MHLHRSSSAETTQKRESIVRVLHLVFISCGSRRHATPGLSLLDYSSDGTGTISQIPGRELKLTIQNSAKRNKIYSNYKTKHTHIQTHARTRTRTPTHTRTHAHTPADTQTQISTHTHTRARTHTHSVLTLTHILPPPPHRLPPSLSLSLSLVTSDHIHMIHSTQLPATLSSHIYILYIILYIYIYGTGTISQIPGRELKLTIQNSAKRNKIYSNYKYIYNGSITVCYRPVTGTGYIRLQLKKGNPRFAVKRSRSCMHCLRPLRRLLTFCFRGEELGCRSMAE